MWRRRKIAPAPAWVKSIYKFVRREIPGAFKRGWHHERERLAKLGYRPFTWRNPILLSWMLTLAIGGALIAVFGWILLPFLIITMCTPGTD